MRQKRWDSLLPSNPDTLHWLGEIARKEGGVLYLVGGAVRDMILGKGTEDIDLAFEGNVQRLGRSLASALDAHFTYHASFLSGTIAGPGNKRIDINRTRIETYPAAGKLPKVRPANIEKDLYRRDFTVNAVAFSLNPEGFGQMIDPLEGRRDIEKGVIRVLHELSFADDPTRIFRAVRYSERLGFRVEKETMGLLRGAVNRISTLSPERLFYEQQCISREPGKVRVNTLRRLRELGALSFLGKVYKPLSPARLLKIPDEQACEFLCLFFSHFTAEKVKILPVKKACLETTSTLRQASSILTRLRGMNKASSITRFLSAFDERGLRAITVSRESREIEKIITYLEVYSKVRIKTTGEDIKRLGIPPGTRYREILDSLLSAKLDGRIKTKNEELTMIDTLIKER